MEVCLGLSGSQAGGGWGWIEKATLKIGSRPGGCLIVSIESHEGLHFEASKEKGTDLRDVEDRQWIGLCNWLDKGNGEEEIKDEIEQWFLKRVLRALSFFFEMKSFTKLQHIKLIKVEQLTWMARWEVHQFQCSWPRNGHNTLNGKIQPWWQGTPSCYLQKEGTGLVINLVLENFEVFMGRLGGIIQRWSLQIWSSGERARLRFHLGVTCLLANLWQHIQDCQIQLRSRKKRAEEWTLEETNLRQIPTRQDRKRKMHHEQVQSHVEQSGSSQSCQVDSIESALWTLSSLRTHAMT